MRLHAYERVTLTVATSILVMATALSGGAQAGKPEVKEQIAKTQAEVRLKHAEIRKIVPSPKQIAVVTAPPATPKATQKATQAPVRVSQASRPKPVIQAPKATVAVATPQPVASDEHAYYWNKCPPTGPYAHNQEIGRAMLFERGWGVHWCSAQAHLTHESGWYEQRWNGAGSGAYGIPQALPGSKMKSHGADWRTNPRVQIAWYMDYVQGRYGNPSKAYAFFQRNNWY